MTLAAVPNSYFPGTGNPGIGATSVTVGTVNGSGATTAISAGDLLLIIQMQGATIDSSQTNRYGDGAGDGTQQDNTGDPARGSSANTAGTYEFAVATSAGPTVGLSAPLQNAYADAAGTATQGQQRYQVIRVPQYASLTLSGTINVPQWNGTSGGVFVLDVAGVLNLNGAVINGNFRGFRGGGGNFQNAITPSNLGYRDLNSTQLGAFKGEGIAGTPALVRDSVTGLNVGTAAGADGYPNGDRSRGAPGNAGGGGNQHNGGGGGGGNGGIGGFGGNLWNASNGATSAERGGGFGGANGYNGGTRLIMGGGGGAGDQNNSAATLAAGGAGGAMVMVRTGSLAGNGNINVNGAAGEASTGTDGSGAGGAGGSVFVTSGSGVLTGLTVSALGGAGANSGNMAGGTETDGPGGGGGGGVLVTNSTGGAFASTGGIPGVMNNSTSATCGSASANPSCFATAGGAGVRVAITIPVASTGVRPAAECLPDLRVTKATSTPQITSSGAVTASYTINVQNFGGGARNVSLIDNALPPGWTLAAVPTYAYSLALPLAANNLSAGAEATAVAGGATFPLQAAPVTVPVVGANNLAWRQFFAAPVKNGAPSNLTITMVVNIPATAPVGCYHNPAGFTYLDPTRVAGAVTREVTAGTNNGANRAGVNYSGNTTFASGSTSAVVGSNYSGLVAGPAAEDICLQGDLSVTKTATPASPTVVSPGATITYTLVPRNNGRQIRDLTFAADQANDATNGNAGTQILAGGILRVVDTLPANVSVTSAFAGTGWACNQVGQTVTCDRTAPIVPLAATTNITNAIVGTVRVTQAACGNSLVNGASISTFRPGYTESVLTNNTTSVTNPAPACNANLTVTKTDSTTTLAAGSTTSYILNFGNTGPSSADGAVIKDIASAGLACTVASCTPSGSAVCPAPLAGLLTVAGIAIATFPSGGALQYVVNCGVTATGQ